MNTCDNQGYNFVMRRQDTLLNTGLLFGGCEINHSTLRRLACPTPLSLSSSLKLSASWREQRVLVSTGSPVFSPQVVDIKKKKKWNISGIPTCIENTIMRIEYPPSTLINKTPQTQARLPVYSFCLLRGNHYFHTWFIFLLHMCISINNI